MGLAIAKLFVQQDASVVATDVNEAKLSEAFSDHARVRAVAVDITATEAPAQIVEAAVDAFGGIDILVNAAGIFQMVEVCDIQQDLWDRTMAVNVTAPIRLRV